MRALNLTGVDFLRECQDGFDGLGDGGADRRRGRKFGRTNPVMTHPAFLVRVRDCTLFEGVHVGEGLGHRGGHFIFEASGCRRTTEVDGEAMLREV